jgi:hypothetical protein
MTITMQRAVWREQFIIHPILREKKRSGALNGNWKSRDWERSQSDHDPGTMTGNQSRRGLRHECKMPTKRSVRLGSGLTAHDAKQRAAAHGRL